MKKVKIKDYLGIHAYYGKLSPERELDVSDEFYNAHSDHMELLEDSKPEPKPKKSKKDKDKDKEEEKETETETD